MTSVKYEAPLTLNPAMQSWSMRLGELISLIGRPEFNSSVARILSDVVPFQHLTAYRYQPNKKPVTLFHTVTPERVDRLVHHYADEAFRLDPFTRAALDQSSDQGVVALRTLSPGFERSDYFRTFYRDAGLHDEVGFLVRLGEEQAIVVSLIRDNGAACFTQEERDQLCWREPLMRELFRQHWGYDKRSDQVEPAVVQAAQSGVAHLLSRREFEIVCLIVTGYSSEAIAGILDISLGTVKVHRKNIYRKLAISSQAELFHLCLTSRSEFPH